jgi:hypothetical protein
VGGGSTIQLESTIRNGKQDIMEPDLQALENAVFLAAHRANQRFGQRAASPAVAESIALAAAEAVSNYLEPIQQATNDNLLLITEKMNELAAQMAQAKAEGKTLR